MRGESRPHELFSFIRRCYYCSVSVSPPPPLFNPSSSSSPPSLPLFVSPGLSSLRCNHPLVVAVSPQRCCCHADKWAAAADVCNLGNRSLTCSGIKSPSLLRHPIGIPCSYSFLWRLLHDFPLQISSSSFSHHMCKIMIVK